MAAAKLYTTKTPITTADLLNDRVLPMYEAHDLQRHLRAFPQDNLAGVYQVTFRKKIYTTLEELQADLDAWLVYYNYERTHQGKMCCGRTPMATLDDGKRIWKEKFIA